MRDGGTRPLLFLVTCLGFAEATLGILATFDRANPNVLAGFALASLGMVLLSLVAMYWRDPAFLTFSSRQSLDLRIIQELREQPDMLGLYLQGVLSRDTDRRRAPSVSPPHGIADALTEDYGNELGTLRGA